MSTKSTATGDFTAELDRRGLLHQTTAGEELSAHLASGSRLIYAGFDPTADSLTIGNLVAITLLRHAQRAGHTPVVLMGGGTGLIGDPSGKSAERELNTPERVTANVEGQRRIFESLLDFSDSLPNRARIVNNMDWLRELSFIDALRDIGKHFSVNMMMQKDSVRDRLTGRDHGISYTEFSYMLLQSYDFWYLHTHWADRGLPGPVTVQMGGSDQWGNIVSGIDYTRRVTGRGEQTREQREQTGPFGLTAPLVTRSDGGKFGKTESGAVWLTADRTSPYAFYQFWLNTSDEDAVRFLRLYTLMEWDEVESIAAEHAADPAQRRAQRALARAVTSDLHGPTEADRAEAAARALFSGDLEQIPAETLEEIFAEVPSSDHPRSRLEGEGLPVLELLVEVGLAKSKREGREFLASGSVSVNGRKVEPEARLTVDGLLGGRLIALRRGKKSWHLTRWG